MTRPFGDLTGETGFQRKEAMQLQGETPRSLSLVVIAAVTRIAGRISEFEITVEFTFLSHLAPAGTAFHHGASNEPRTTGGRRVLVRYHVHMLLTKENFRRSCCPYYALTMPPNEGG